MQRTLVLSLAVLLIAPVPLFAQRSDERIVCPNEEDAVGVTILETTPDRLQNPYLAWGLSALLPGMGQFYNGQPGKGALHLALLFGSFVAASEFRDIPEEVGLVGLWGTWIWSMIDAPLAARAINEGRVRVSVGQSGRPLVGLDRGVPFSRRTIDVLLSVRVPDF